MKQSLLNKLHLLPVLAMVLLMPQRMAAQTNIVVVSDIHVMAPSLLPSGAETQEAWINYYYDQRKMLEESAGLFTDFVTAIKSSPADIVLITGDLTKDGEQYSHSFVRSQLGALTAAGKKVFVIPGNHDFGEEGNHTQFYADGTTTNATVLSASGFAAYYNGFGYGTGSTIDPNGSLSYVAEPVKGLVLLAIDSHSGSVSAETLTWLCNQANTANAQGKQVIAMMHHPLIEHIKGASNFITTYTVAKPSDVRDALIAAGVKVILTGHFHASDIAYDWNEDSSNGIYDINTGSLISYPCDYRILTLSQDLQTLDVATVSMNPSDEFENWLRVRLKNIAKAKMNEKAGTLASAFATYINNLAEFAASLFILHTKGDENSTVNQTERADIATTYEGYKSDPIYSAALSYGNIDDASVYSVLDNKSNYGDAHERQTADRTLSIPLRSLNEKVTLSSAGWASYCTGHDLDISLTSGVQAFAVSASNATSVTLTEVTQIPADEGFLLKGTASAVYTLKPAATLVSAITNQLVGTLVETPAPSGSYVLANKSSGLGFYPTGSVTIPARKAYLPSSSSARMLSIGGDGEATGISTLETEDGNGQTIYTLQGTKAGNLHRGLYIQNGKKIIIK